MNEEQRHSDDAKAGCSSLGAELPPFALTDAYKLTHHTMYPSNVTFMSAYSEFRQAFNQDPNDERIVFYGLRHYIENYVSRRWTQESLTQLAHFCSTFNAGGTQFPYPRELFEDIVNENEGYFPVRISALPEGSVVYPHTPLFVVEGEGKYAVLATFLETLLTMSWYPSTVATLSRRVRSIIESAFDQSVDQEAFFLLASRLHDFGFRACTSVEQSMIGGAAHLLSFDGTDTLSAAHYAQYALNGGRPVASSIPATEHSVMTAWASEREALANLLARHGSGVVACVMDSYDYAVALEKVLPDVLRARATSCALQPETLGDSDSALDEAVATNCSSGRAPEPLGVLVLRPDSGDTIATVLHALRAAESAFGADLNSKSYKVLRNSAVIQGDGIDAADVAKILKAVMAAGYSAQNVAFGMGGALLQRVNRDTMSFATKLSFVQFADGAKRDVAKLPRTDSKKFSLPGRLQVYVPSAPGSAPLPLVLPAECPAPENMSTALEVVYDGRDPASRHVKWDDFDIVRTRMNASWNKLPAAHDPISLELRAKIASELSKRRGDQGN